MAIVLVVDDDSDVLDSLAAMVRSGDHQVITARNGVDALLIIESSVHLDLMLTDIVMPGLHGFNLARMAKIKRPSLRVLYLSGFTEGREVTRDTGPQYGKLLHKPIIAEALNSEIAAALA
jgi:two-component system, cell cycle sensor histidine kinase and response regulator CckA